MPDHVNVRFNGLRALDRALGKADKNLRRDLRARLRDIAEGVAQSARRAAAQKTRTRSGDLVKGIRPFVKSGAAGVRSSAVHGGYEYPKRLEFEGRRGGSYGPRASLYPALEADEFNVVAAAERLLDDIADDFEKDGA